jgi:hypothetical protein
MKSSDPTVRRVLLKSLVRRRAVPAQNAKMEKAFRELEERAVASAVLPSFVATLKQMRIDNPKERWKDPEAARLGIQFAGAMYLAREISLQEYTFLVANAAEGVHDARIQAGVYSDLAELSKLMREIESAHGLKAGEYWLIKEAPADYRSLNSQWDNRALERLSQTLVELEGQAVSALFRTNRREYDRLRERGRRSFFHKDEFIRALVDTIKRYEREASASAAAGAFTAAVTLLGASVEGLLLLRCLRSQTKASLVAASLPAKKRPRDPKSPVHWTFNNLIQVCLAAGWLPIIDTTTMEVRPDELAHLLRQLRNYIHPGKVCNERPWIETERRDFDDAEIIYNTLFATVFKGALLRRYLESELRVEANNAA